MVFTPETTLFTRISDNPLDETARVEYEAVLRSQSPVSREVRYLELERRLADIAEEPEEFAAVLARLDELLRVEFSWDDRLWKSVIPRRFDLWLDYFDPCIALAVENALRLRCEIDSSDAGTVTPLVIARQIPASACGGIRSGVHEFICRYEHRPNHQTELSRDKIRMTIRPAWIRKLPHRTTTMF